MQEHLESLEQTKGELVAAVADVARRGMELQAWGVKEERALNAANGGGSGSSSGSGVNGVNNDNSGATAVTAADKENAASSNNSNINVSSSNNDDTNHTRLMSCFVPYDTASQQLVELHAELRYTN